jgi:hypothetical protein
MEPLATDCDVINRIESSVHDWRVSQAALDTDRARRPGPIPDR